MNNLQLENVSRETLAFVDTLLLHNATRLDAYADRLLWWNRKVNLVSRDLTKDDILLHIKHSLIPASRLSLSGIPLWVDAGTGGGLPGIPLAIANPDIQFILNDVAAKKGSALKDIIRSLELNNASVVIQDVAHIEIDNPFGVLSKHAFKLSDLLYRLHGKTWAELLMLKGSDFSSELTDVNIDTPLNCVAVSLATTEPTTFFKGKYLIRICPT